MGKSYLDNSEFLSENFKSHLNVQDPDSSSNEDMRIENQYYDPKVAQTYNNTLQKDKEANRDIYSPVRGQDDLKNSFGLL